MMPHRIPNAQTASLLATPAPASMCSDIQYVLNGREIHPGTMLFNLLVTKGLQERRCLHTHQRIHYGEGTALTALCLSTGAVCVAHEHAGEYGGPAMCLYVWYEQDTQMSLTLGKRTTHLSLTSLDPDFTARLLAQVDAIIIPRDPQLSGLLKMLCYERGHFYLTDLGDVDQAFQPSNYTAEIRAGFDFITMNLASETPNGRLYVLYGPPGSGKSFFIKGVMVSTEAKYIYVPSSLIGRLTSPDLVPALLHERAHEDDQIPLCLIMEDADNSLVQRAMDNASVVADMLNMSDGFLGELANLHIMATVNAKKRDIDSALLRPGRLGVYLEFTALSRSHAVDVFTALCREHQLSLQHPSVRKAYAALVARYDTHQKQATLAEVYAFARTAGWGPSMSPGSRGKRRQQRAGHSV